MNWSYNTENSTTNFMFMTWYIVQHVITLYSTINKNNLIKLVSDV